MEEDKAAAYYDELTRKGGGAARFKQGLGFSSSTTTPNSDEPPKKGSALPSSSSFLSNFVKASSPTKETEVDRKIQLENIHNKLKKKEPTTSIEAPSEKIRVRDSPKSRDRRRSRSRERERERERGREKDLRRGRSRSRSRSRERRRSRRSGDWSDEEKERLKRRYRGSSKERRRERSRERRGRRRSRSRSCSDDERRSGRRHRRSRSFSPRDRRRSDKGREGGGKGVKKEGNGVADYAKLIDGYDKMTPAERVKAKMKLQLTQTAEKDTKMGTSSQWERFEFNKDAPVDDEEIEAADDDAALVKHIGKSFRFKSLEAKSEDKIQNAHDEAMFGVPESGPLHASENEEERGNVKVNANVNEETKDDDPASDLINEKVLSKPQGSWRDRARRTAG